MSLRTATIRLAYQRPELRADLLPLLQEQSDPASHDQNKPESYYGLPPRGVQASYRKEAMSLIGLTEEDRDAVLRMYMQRGRHTRSMGYASSGEPAFSVRSFKFTKGTVSRLMKHGYAKDGSDFYSSGGSSSLRLTQQGILAGKFIQDNPDEKFEKVLGYPVSFTRRVYGQFKVYTWASVRIDNEWVSLGDPYPAPRWPSAALEKSVALALESQAAEAPRGIQASDASEAADILENFMGLVGDEPSSHNKKQWDAAHKALKSKDVAVIYKAFVDLEQSEGGEPPDDDVDVADHWDDLKRGMRKFKPKQAARRDDPNRVVFKVSRQVDTGEFTVHNMTGREKHTLSGHGSDPQELAETLEASASTTLRFQNMDTLDGMELNYVQAPRFPRHLAERLVTLATVIVGAHYVALRGSSMGLEWQMLANSPRVTG